MAGEAGGTKWMSVGKLKELLTKIDNELLISTQTMAQTGNLTVFTKDNSCVAVIGFLEETIESYE